MNTMQEQSVIHSTFVIERSYPATPERVFAAFADPAKKRRWFVEGGHHQVEHYEMDFRIGGIELTRSRFKEGTRSRALRSATIPSTGTSCPTAASSWPTR